jgi:hypothetical protein
MYKREVILMLGHGKKMEQKEEAYERCLRTELSGE